MTAAACEAAERAVRDLIHRTRPAAGELTDPAQAADVIAALAAVAGMLPQLLDQLGRWLLLQHDGGRLRVDSDAPDRDARHAVHAAATALEHAGQCLHRAGHALDTAHQHAAHLAIGTSAIGNSAIGTSAIGTSDGDQRRWAR